jgi:hypothetical protein
MDCSKAPWQLPEAATIKVIRKGASVMSNEKQSLYEGGVIFDEIEMEEAEQVIAPAILLSN